MRIEQIFNELEDFNNKYYRFHLAKPSGRYYPIEALAHSKEEWLSWQLYKGASKERFPYPTKYIFSFAQLSGNEFIFGGIFEILNREGEKYEVKYIDKYDELIGRVVLTYTGSNVRGTVFTPSYILENSEINEIYKLAYKGEKFCGIENINHSYNQLKLIFDNKIEDWRSVLSNVKGIYLLADNKSGKLYIGSAKGSESIYGRWSNYIYGLDGGNLGLRELIEEKGEEYFKENIKFSILETINMSFDDKSIEAKESLWKEKLLSRKFGYNKN